MPLIKLTLTLTWLGCITRPMYRSGTVSGGNFFFLSHNLLQLSGYTGHLANIIITDVKLCCTYACRIVGITMNVLYMRLLAKKFLHNTFSLKYIQEATLGTDDLQHSHLQHTAKYLIKEFMICNPRTSSGLFKNNIQLLGSLAEDIR